MGGAIPPLAAAFGSVAISLPLCALALLSLVCGSALRETKDRDPRQARPSATAIR